MFRSLPKAYINQFILQHISKGGAGRLHILFLFFISIMFSISLWTLLGYHIYLVTVNRTTLGKSVYELIPRFVFTASSPRVLNELGRGGGD